MNTIGHFPDQRNPLDQVPSLIRDHGLCDAHTYPLVSKGKMNGRISSFRVRPEDAFTYPSVELRTGNSYPVLLFDFDREDTIDYLNFLVREGFIPQPNWIVVRQSNGHGHAAYTLKVPVHRGESARIKPLNFFGRVSEYLAWRTGSDPGYNGVLTHNPVAPKCFGLETHWARTEPYKLIELARFIDPTWHVPEIPLTGVGRNCSLFNAGMKWAGSYKHLGSDVYTMLCQMNQQLSPPLADQEVQGIAQSVEKYRRRWIAKGLVSFADWCRRQQRKGALKRRERSRERDAAIVEGYKGGKSQRVLAGEFGLPRTTVQYILARDLEPSDGGVDGLLIHR